MKQSYFPDVGIWLKGNIHSHSTVSDGMFTPAELSELYRSHGYDFLSITDHNILDSHSDLQTNGLILLTGVEHDIAYGPDKCTHIVGLSPAGKKETSYICKQYSAEEITEQQLADYMLADGQFVNLAHPLWSCMEFAEIERLNGLHSIEVFNNGMEHLCHGGNSEIFWEMLLRHGKRIFATAVDDVHVSGDLFGGWVCVKVANRSQEDILAALVDGAFYASSGPTIYNFGIDRGSVYISCSPCRAIHFVSYPSKGKSFFSESDLPLVSSSHTLEGREAYVRAVCVDDKGYSAWTNPIFFDNRQ